MGALRKAQERNPTLFFFSRFLLLRASGTSCTVFMKSEREREREQARTKKKETSMDNLTGFVHVRLKDKGVPCSRFFEPYFPFSLVAYAGGDSTPPIMRRDGNNLKRKRNFPCSLPSSLFSFCPFSASAARYSLLN